MPPGKPCSINCEEQRQLWGEQDSQLPVFVLVLVHSFIYSGKLLLDARDGRGLPGPLKKLLRNFLKHRVTINYSIFFFQKISTVQLCFQFDIQCGSFMFLVIFRHFPSPPTLLTFDAKVKTI